MYYTVYHKAPGQLFWSRIKNVHGDSILEGQHSQKHSVRVIIDKNEVRYEIPMTWAIKFSRERFLSIKQNMEEEAGQALKLKIPKER